MNVQKTLHDDHTRLDVLFEALLNHVHVNDAEAVQAAWTELEQGLTAHLEAEETVILPLFDQFDPFEAAVIRSDHIEIRRLLGELGLMLDLHVLREEKVEELVELLRAHAAREENLMYHWAENELPEPSRKSLLPRLLGMRARREAVTHTDAP